jgi:hypothetical protein
VNTNGIGPLRQALEDAAYQSGCSMSSLTVLSAQRDPYRLDTPAGHRDSAWFAEMVDRFLEPEIDSEAPVPLFTTEEDFFTATRRLIAHKALENTEHAG